MGRPERIHHVVRSPLGELTIVAADGQLCGLYFSEHRHPPVPALLGRRTAVGFTAITAELEEYFAGTRTVFDIPTAPAGTPFQLAIWQALQRIPYGQTRTYGQLAAELGRPGLVRAVGAANGRNPISIIIPCHRLVGRDGSLTGYGGGLAAKRFLLDLETGSADQWTWSRQSIGTRPAGPGTG